MESYRSHYSKDVTEKEYGKLVTISGWVEDIRNIGSIAFIIRSFLRSWFPYHVSQS